MNVEIRVPDLPESVADATVGNWHKHPGEHVEVGELLVEIETDKVVLEVPAPESGIVEEILFERGSTVTSRQLLARLRAGEAAPAAASGPEADVITPSVRRLLAEKGLDASQIVGSGNNDINTQQNKWKKIVDPLWQSGASAPYILMSSKANDNKLGNKFYDRVPLDMKNWVDNDTDNLCWSGYLRFGVGFFDWRHVIMGGATTGTTLV